jgi:hypothetical protein
MVMNKKSVVFTMIATVLLSVILLTFLVYTSNKTNVDIQKTNSEIQTLNSFTKAVNTKYLPSAAALSATQATKAIIQHIEVTGYYLPSAYLSGLYDDIMLNEEQWEEQQSYMGEGGVNYTLYALLDEIKGLGELTGINFTYSNPRTISISESEPFAFKVSYYIDYNISSSDGKTFFYYPNQKIVAKVPVHNFRDPLRIIENQNIGLPANNISVRQAFHEEWNQSSLIYDIDYTAYVASQNAPSFLDRLKPNPLSRTSEYGIYSFINTQYYTNPNGYTTVDYLYFASNSLDNSFVNLPGYPNFYLQWEQRIKYNLFDG